METFQSPRACSTDPTTAHPRTAGDAQRLSAHSKEGFEPPTHDFHAVALPLSYFKSIVLVQASHLHVRFHRIQIYGLVLSGPIADQAFTGTNVFLISFEDVERAAPRQSRSYDDRLTSPRYHLFQAESSNA